MNGPKYGYEIKKYLEEITSTGIIINNNMIYPMLDRFVKSNMVIKELHIQEGKPNRYIYYITEVGSDRFFELISDLPDKLASNLEEFLTRVSFFEYYVDKAAQEKIIDKRDKYLRILLDFYKERFEVLRGNYLPRINDYVEAEITKIETELHMIEKLRKKYID